jgi:hypothetical protein
MRADTQKLGHSLVSPRRIEDHLPGALVGNSVIKIIKQERGALDAHQVGNIEACGREFRTQLSARIPAARRPKWTAGPPPCRARSIRA